MSDVALRDEVEAILKHAGIAEAPNDATSIVEAARSHADPATLADRARAMAARRAAGTPLMYLVGHARFMGVDLAIAPGALIPRQDTELLGYTALRLLEERVGKRPCRVIDMCCGSANLACGIATGSPSASIWASDLTDGACAVARSNIVRLGLDSRVTVWQ